jgi:hypothetical protein
MSETKPSTSTVLIGWVASHVAMPEPMDLPRFRVFGASLLNRYGKDQGNLPWRLWRGLIDGDDPGDGWPSGNRWPGSTPGWFGVTFMIFEAVFGLAELCQ